MSIKVKSKRDKTTVETDYRGSQLDHSIVHRDRGLIGAMNAFGISEVRGSKSSGVSYSLEKNFDEKIKKKYGRDQGYFNPY